MLKGRYYVFDVERGKDDKVKVWLDGKFTSIRLIDQPTFTKLQAIWRARSTLLLAVMVPAAALLLFLFAQQNLDQETFAYITFAALLIDMSARLMLSFHERRAYGRFQPHSVPAEAVAEMQAAAQAGDIERLRGAAAKVVVQMGSR